MNYLSVCSGIEAASMAWHPMGWNPVAFSEIEPFPSAVLAHYYPTVPNHCHTLSSGSHAPAIVHGTQDPCTSEIAFALGRNSGQENALIEQSQVRRLTPVECARLQGFPDTYLDIQYRNRPAADGNKYKALGNSMAVPCMAWIGKRIQMVEELTA